jgi:hypothetical protein
VPGDDTGLFQAAQHTCEHFVRHGGAQRVKKLIMAQRLFMKFRHHGQRPFAGQYPDDIGRFFTCCHGSPWSSIRDGTVRSRVEPSQIGGCSGG